MNFSPVLLTAGLALLSCSLPTGVAWSASPLGASRIADSSLQFESPQERAVFDALEASIVKLSSADGWRSRPYETLGNFVRAWWCSGAAAPENCAFAESIQHRRPQHLVALHTLRYPHREPNQAFGVGASAHWVPAGEGWGANVWLSFGGKSVTGDGFHLNFTQWQADASAPLLKLSLGSSIGYDIHETKISVALEGHPLEHARIFATSPEAMRTTGLKQLADLEAKFELVISQGEARICEYGPYLGGGIPPVCNPRPLNAGETKKAREAFRAWIEPRRAALNEHALALHSAAMRAFPFSALTAAIVAPFSSP